MEDYAKLTAESYYRLEYAKKKTELTILWWIFLKTIPEIIISISGFLKFPTMLSLIISWLKECNSGILSQQFIMAEGGFKSYINGTVDQWMLTHNVEANVWKMIDVYADFGVYKTANILQNSFGTVG